MSLEISYCSRLSYPQQLVSSTNATSSEQTYNRCVVVYEYSRRKSSLPSHIKSLLTPLKSTFCRMMMMQDKSDVEIALPGDILSSLPDLIIVLHAGASLSHNGLVDIPTISKTPPLSHEGIEYIRVPRKVSIGEAYLTCHDWTRSRCSLRNIYLASVCTA
jgi:hypothetical protein